MMIKRTSSTSATARPTKDTSGTLEPSGQVAPRPHFRGCSLCADARPRNARHVKSRTLEQRLPVHPAVRLVWRCAALTWSQDASLFCEPTIRGSSVDPDVGCGW